MLRVAGHLVTVFHLRDGTVRATQPWCPHRAGPLADGLLGDCEVVCPLHGRTFDLDTGAAGEDETGIVVHPARLAADGTILLELPEDGPLASCTDGVAPDAAPGPQAAAAPFSGGGQPDRDG